MTSLFRQGLTGLFVVWVLSVFFDGDVFLLAVLFWLMLALLWKALEAM